MLIIQIIQNRLKRELNLYRNHRQVRRIARDFPVLTDDELVRPVIFFNASTRLSGLSQNAGFSLITSLSLRKSGIPVLYFVCNRGLSHCVLGTDREKVSNPPPCPECIRTSRLIYDGAEVEPYQMVRDGRLEDELCGLSLKELLKFEYNGFPAGSLVLPSLRWILRIHHLQDDEDTRYLTREYILSAWNVKQKFEIILDKYNPFAVVVFNGMFYPEASARWAAKQRGVPVYSHEVGMLPLSAFFTKGDATAYPVEVDEFFRLSPEQNDLLNQTLEKRTKGKFITAGVQFWPEMIGLNDEIEDLAEKHEALVPIFTNVVFDTSQGHANVVFEHMFEWLDEVLRAVKSHPDTLFVVRAHPDELRPGKESRETVSEWIEKNRVKDLENIIYIAHDVYISSYELIRRAKFVMVYNSTIGLEASIMGRPVLCAGKARYTQISTVFFPDSKRAFIKKLNEFLEAGKIEVPVEFISNARRVLYSQLFRASLPFGDFLKEDGVWRGYVNLRNFSANDLLPENSDVMQVLHDGIIHGKPFIRDI